MRINSIKANNCVPNFKAKPYTGSIAPSFRTDFSRGEKIAICALTSAVVGVAIASIAITKKSGKNPIKLMQIQKDKFTKKFHKAHPKQDRLTKILKGRRDETAVVDYQIFQAQKKIASLDKKILNNEINISNPNIRQKLVKNKVELERFIQSARYM
jgi:cell division protein FtsL